MGDVKRRSYSSPTRLAQAAATRERIIDAAAALFLERGYTSTTTAAVGEAADLSEASVFARFGSKADLLIAVVSRQVGQGGDFPLRDGPVWQALAADPDKTAALREFARITRRAHEHSWRLLDIVAAAAHDDPILARAAANAGMRRHGDCAWFVTTIIGLPRSSAARKIDATWALISVENYRRLVIERGWSHQRYETWLAVTLRATLLSPT